MAYESLSKVRDTDPVHLAKLLQVLGTKEIPGKVSHPVIAEMLACVGLSGSNDDTTAWCSAAANWAFNGKGTGSAAARSWLKWGEPIELASAQRGDVCVFSRPGASWQGHVAFFLEAQPGQIIVVGGNQTNMVCAQAYSLNRLLGVRRATESRTTRGRRTKPAEV